MRIGKLKKSPRLRRVAAFLSDGLEHSTLEILEGAHILAVNSACSDLRAKGYDIRCTRRGDYWYYRLVSTPVDTGNEPIVDIPSPTVSAQAGSRQIELL